MLKKLYKILRRVFFYVLFILIVLVSAGMLSLYFYGDKIKSHIVRNFNENINTPIGVSSVDIDATSNFPFVTILFADVDIKESYKFSENSLLTAESIECRLNPLNLIRGDYTIHSLIINDGMVDFRVNRSGEINYQITKSSGERGERTAFEINRFILKNMKVNWNHQPKAQDFGFFSEDLEATIEQGDSSLVIALEGIVEINKFRFNKNGFIEGRKFRTSAALDYFNDTGRIRVNNSTLSLNEADFEGSGTYDPSKNGRVDFNLSGKNTTIQNLVSLLPEGVAKTLSDYKSDGEVYFDLKLEGNLNSDEYPSLNSTFGVSGARITYPPTGKSITNASFDGVYKSKSINDLKTAEVSISNFTGTLDDRPLKGNLRVRDFTDRKVDLTLAGEFMVPSLMEFIPQKIITGSEGEVQLDINFSGRLKDLEKLATINRVSSDGQITLRDVGFTIENINQSFNELNGILLFNKNTIAMQGLSGRFGDSDFRLDGEISNMLSYLLMDNQPLRLKASLKSTQVDMDQLLAARTGKQEGSYSLYFSPYLNLEFDCQVGSVKFRRFSGTNLSGVLKIKDQLAMLQKIKFNEIGGDVFLEGLVDTKGETVDVLTKFNTSGIHVDSLFYVFDDFGQDFLLSSNLRGRVTSNVRADMRFTRDLLFIPQSLVADMNVSIEGGELNRFEPIQELSRFIPDDSLQYLRFSNLENEIHVENQVIYLPRMEVKSNVTSITIGGTYTFDHRINFKIVAPLVHTRKIDKDEVFGAIEDDGTGVPKIHLLLTGTADDYIVALDKQGMKNQMVTSLKNEVKELKEAFKKKSQDKKKKLVLDEDEFFDWEDNNQR